MKKFSKVLALFALAGMGAAAIPAAQAQMVTVNVSVNAAVKNCFGSPLRVLGLTSDQRLLCFAEGRPFFAITLGVVSGLTGDTKLIGIDYRRNDLLLYGVGNAGGIYTIVADTAAATKVGQLTVVPSGTAFGVDFNPTSGALRIVSDSGQNLRHSFTTATTTADPVLNYTPGVTALGIGGAAYTNNDIATETGTTLFVLDAAQTQIAIQSTANSGVLVPTGKLYYGVTGQVGFDIYSSNSDGRTANFNRGYASVKNPNTGIVTFFQVDLLLGRMYPVQQFKPSDDVIDIALPLDRNSKL